MFWSETFSTISIAFIIIDFLIHTSILYIKTVQSTIWSACRVGLFVIIIVITVVDVNVDAIVTVVVIAVVVVIVVVVVIIVVVVYYMVKLTFKAYIELFRSHV